MRHAFLSSVAALALCGLVSGQSNVVVNEVLYDPTGPDSGNEIIEIANLGTAAQNLTGWSLCVAFSGLNARAYWNFPAGTSIPAEGFIQVHWFRGGVNTATELFTGTPFYGTCFNVMQLLNNTKGAVAIYKTQGCLAFPSSANIVDFMQWGGSGTIRESVAVAAGIWTAGTAIPLVDEGNSIAYDGTGNLTTDYVDAPCPTLGSANIFGTGLVVNYGAGCPGTGGLVPQAATVGGAPTLGNQAFGLTVQNAIPAAPAFLAVGLAPVSVPLLGCTFLVNPLAVLSSSVGAIVPVPVSCDPGLVGLSLFFQWAVFDIAAPQQLAFSDGLQVMF